MLTLWMCSGGKKDKEKKGVDGWAKMGRRIGIAVGLGKSRDRKSRSMEGMGMLEDEMVTNTHHQLAIDICPLFPDFQN